MSAAQSRAVTHSVDRYLETVMQKLEPLRRGGWLSRVEDGKLIESSLTICLSGRWEPLIDQIQAMEPRFVFIDGPLMTLGKDTVNWTSLLAPIGRACETFASFAMLC